MIARCPRPTAVPALLPGALVVALFAYWLMLNGVPVTQVCLFLLVQASAYAVPGTLAWRVLRGGRDPGVVDVVLGTIALHAAMVPWYVLVRWAGHPRLVWVLPVATVLAALAVAHRRRTPAAHLVLGARPIPSWAAWNAAAAIGVGSALAGHWLPSVTGPLRAWLTVDASYLLAVAGEVKHHVAPTTPFVAGESLDYHWFAFADMSATSWLGGQELDLLVIQLVPLAQLFCGLAAFGVLGWKVTGSARGGVLGLWLGVLVGSINAIGATNGAVVDSTLLMVSWIDSCTQGFAQMLCAAALVVIADLLRSRPARAADGFLFVLLTGAICGGKASFVPVLGAGALVVAILAWRRKQSWRIPVVLGTVLAAELVFAQVVLFRGANQGITVGPLEQLEHVGVYVGTDGGHGLGAALVLIYLLGGWLLPLLGLGAAFLPAFRERLLGDPIVCWILAMGAAGMAAALILDHPGFSQYFFLRAGLPFAYLPLAAALLLLWDRAAPAVRSRALIAGGVGLAGCLLVRAATGPTDAGGGLEPLTIGALAPVGLVVGAWALGLRRAPRRGRRIAALLVAASLAVGLGAARTAYLAVRLDETRIHAAGPSPAPVPRGGVEAARFVRAHSGPDEFVATNGHCYRPQQRSCLTAASWISAWSERRTVVQGWALTAKANAVGGSMDAVTHGPFWDPALLALNDRVFFQPTRAEVDALLARFEVHWLLVDRRYPADLDGLREMFPHRRKFGHVTLFDVTSVR